jgi:hypothetical protein
MIINSNSEGANGVCTVAKKLSLQFKYTISPTPSTDKSAAKTNAELEIITQTYIKCSPKSDDFLRNGSPGDVRSSEEESGHKTEVTQEPQSFDKDNTGKISNEIEIKLSNLWYVEKICNTCCKELQSKRLEKKIKLTSMSVANSLKPRRVFDSVVDDLKKKLQDGQNNGPITEPDGYVYDVTLFTGNSDVQLLIQHISDLLYEVTKQVNDSGYLTGPQAITNLESNLTEKTKKVDEELKELLNCSDGEIANVCKPCDNLGWVQDSDPTYPPNDLDIKNKYPGYDLVTENYQENIFNSIPGEKEKLSGWVKI